MDATDTGVSMFLSTPMMKKDAKSRTPSAEDL